MRMCNEATRKNVSNDIETPPPHTDKVVSISVVESFRVKTIKGQHIISANIQYLVTRVRFKRTLSVYFAFSFLNIFAFHFHSISLAFLSSNSRDDLRYVWLLTFVQFYAFKILSWIAAEGNIKILSPYIIYVEYNIDSNIYYGDLFLFTFSSVLSFV